MRRTDDQHNIQGRRAAATPGTVLLIVAAGRALTCLGFRVRAERVAAGRLEPKFAKTANGWQRVFSQIVEMVTLSDGTVHFFELMDRKQFLAQLASKGDQ